MSTSVLPHPVGPILTLESVVCLHLRSGPERSSRWNLFNKSEIWSQMKSHVLYCCHRCRDSGDPPKVLFHVRSTNRVGTREPVGSDPSV